MFISSTIWRSKAGSSSLRFRISATLLTSILAMGNWVGFPKDERVSPRRRDNKNMDPLPTAQRDDELFDVVNERDEVTGRATRKAVHRERLLHRAVHALAFDREGRVFLQKRSLLKDTSPGCWDSSCSGHLDSGEPYDIAVVREL